MPWALLFSLFLYFHPSICLFSSRWTKLPRKEVLMNYFWQRNTVTHFLPLCYCSAYKTNSCAISMRLNVEKLRLMKADTCFKVSFFSLCLHEEKWQKLTRRLGGTPMAAISTLSGAWTNDASSTSPSSFSRSQFTSLPLKTDKAFLCWIQPLLRAVLRETMPPRLFKGLQQGKSLARGAAQGSRCTWNVDHNNGEQGQRNATHPKGV